MSSTAINNMQVVQCQCPCYMRAVLSLLGVTKIFACSFGDASASKALATSGRPTWPVTINPQSRWPEAMSCSVSANSSSVYAARLWI